MGTQRKHTYIIAEAGVNHNGSLKMAKELVEAAANAGADAVKFQTFKAEKLVSRNAPKAGYQTMTTDAAESQFDMIRKLELDEEAHRVLIEHCHVKGIQFLSTPFDFDSLEMLARTFDLPRLKLPSGEITNAPLLLRAARTGKPVILSTGMSTLGEVEAALGVLAFGYAARKDAAPSPAAFREAYGSAAGQEALERNMVLLHCTTEYPAPFDEVNLRAMDTLQDAFGLPVGFSDHTTGVAVPIAAAARGAMVIEKHFTLGRDLPGPDHKASLEPGELTEMVKAIRQVELALGSRLKAPTMSESKNMSVARKSLVAAEPIRTGDFFTGKNVAVKRPGNGMSPFLYWDVLGKRASMNFERDEVILP
ncbi:N-acetylneuraminate synthase [Geotalea uraniireducens]|uniref:N-acetylneuraminate synthase n=1 Tax=Geotalea uraniireducens (strain Rf4) TaxID=351605 RepID=A5G8W1_GEOUR|nr:N-acetylneuraminate synthase [Geotalea uraniireducens]ABQ28229.1 N-acetylneuraminate synthase [Geotalea uraniireducens Rf4]